MKKIKISAVSYTNTLPFLQGIKASDDVMRQIELSVDVPSACARRLINNEVDLGIVPVAALSRIPNYHIITDYCIGSDGAVDSVFIFSNKPISEIKSIRLDTESRTSNGLARILLTHYWKMNVEVTMAGEADAYVLIGDRTFGKKQDIPYVYDLGEIWKEFTGLPFAYAVWVANKDLPDYFIKSFNDALADGVSHPEDVIVGLPPIKNFDYHYYLTKNLDFNLDSRKRLAIDKYLALYSTLEVIDFDNKI